MGWVLHRLGEPLLSSVRDLVHRNISVPLQKAVRITPTSPTLTERNFTPAFLNALDSINVSQLGKQVPDWRLRTLAGEPVTITVHGSDYVNNYGGSEGRSTFRKMVIPVEQIENALGRYDVTATKDNKFIHKNSLNDNICAKNPLYP